MSTATKNETTEVVEDAVEEVVETAAVKYIAPYELAPAKPGDAGVDLRAMVDGRGVVLRPGHSELIPTGLRLELPEGMAALVLPRSGLALRYGVTIVNSPGLIDSGYRGEVGVLLTNTGSLSLHIKPLDRIAQLVLMQVPALPFVMAEELSESDRGEGGYGSTGVE